MGAASLRSRGGCGQRPAGLLLAGLLAVATVGCANYGGPPPVQLTLAGSQMSVELVESWLRDDPSGRFTVTKLWPLPNAHDGFEKLARGECDLACTDRPLTVRERELFGEREVRGQRVAFYGYALYVHAGNPLDAIFAKHLAMVLQRRITDWHELAGDALPELRGPIQVYGLSKSTRAGMQLSHLARIWFDEPTWQVLDSDQEIIARVAQDPLALGFAGIGYDGDDVRYLGLRMRRTGRPAFPSLEEIESERYGLAKLVYVYHAGPPRSDVQAVLDYLFSDEGRAAIETTGVWPLPRARAAVRPIP